MQAADERALRRLAMNYLKDTYAGGGDYPPTLENAATMTAHALEGAAMGDPCLVAADDDKVVGFIVARGVEFPGMTARHKTIRSWGTYVVPEHRGGGTAASLFIVAGRLARIKGYTRFMGMTFGTDYEAHALGSVNRIPGLQEVGKVLVMDLTRKAMRADEQSAESPARVEA